MREKYEQGILLLIMKSVPSIIFFIGLQFFTLGSEAMKPAPMVEDYVAKFKNTKFTVHAMYEENKTHIKDKKGNIVWSLDEYIAKKAPFLSDDGNVLLLFGDDFVGSHITTGAYIPTGPDPVYFEVFKEGKKTKSVKHSDVYDQSVKDLTKKHDLREKGGGWVQLYELIQNYDDLDKDINWKNSSIRLKLLGGKEKVIDF